MATSHRDVLVEMAEEFEATPPDPQRSDDAVAEAARRHAHALVWLPGTKQSAHLEQRPAALRRRLLPLLAELERYATADDLDSEDLKWLHDNLRLIRAAMTEVQKSLTPVRRVAHVRTPEKDVVPRVLAIAE